MSIPAFLAVDSTTCDISRRVVSGVDDLGVPLTTDAEFHPVWTEIASGVQCVIDPIVWGNQVRQGNDINVQGEIDASEWRLLCGPAVDILVGDMIEADGVDYLVMAMAKFSTHKEARLILS